ncbi:MAG: choice-of-anchor D domain-containing protein, partial [Bacteroidales bacterium]|nr:choice-of-anchor D domain-containing protein [Bacteroidales bacterium]
SSKLDFFAKASASATGQHIQIKYSEDDSNWINIGDEISLASEDTWTLYSIDLSDLSGNYYLAIATYTTNGSGNVYIDHVIGPLITPLVPNAVTLNSPEDAATNQIKTPTLEWTAANTGGVPTGYKIYLDENSEPTTLFADVTASPYTITAPLDFGTTYHWKVVAYNATGEATASTTRSFTTHPLLVPPFTETFTSFPDHWTRLKGLLADPVDFSSTSTLWSDYGFANDGTTGSAKVLIGGDSRRDWLMTTTIDLGDGSTAYRLSFDLALTDTRSTGVAQLTGLDDKFAVVISTDNGATWTSANTLKLWDNKGSENVYNNILNSGEYISIDLSAYSGLVQIGFYGESTVWNANNDLFVDNVTVEELPTTAVFSINPKSKNFGTVNVNENSATQTFTITNAGIEVLEITELVLTGTDTDQFTLTDENSYPIYLANGEKISVNASFEPTSDGDKLAFLDVSDNLGGGVHTIPLYGTGFTPLQGKVCSNPLPLTFPAINVGGTINHYSNDYSETDISPSSSYLNGHDVVYQFTIINDGKLEGTINLSYFQVGAFILDDCPNAENPPTPIIQKTTNGYEINFSDDIAAGTYFLIIA